ncbi:TPA: hypothetical protein DCX15_00555 [bacterium]|nr:hypothetical protein [bacterium]
MSCKERRCLGTYLDGEISGRDYERISAHLKGCKTCSLELEGLKETIGLIKELKQIEPKGDFEDYLRELNKKLNKETERPGLIEEFLNIFWNEPALALGGVSFIVWLGIIRIIGVFPQNLRLFEYIAKKVCLIL